MFVSRNSTTIAVAALMLLTFSACTKTEGDRKVSRNPTAPVETVNGIPITQADLDRAVKALLAQNHMSEKPSPEALKKATAAALEQLTAAELLYQAGSKLEIKDLEKQVATKIAQSKYNYGSQAEFENALKSVDMTPKVMSEAARKDIVINNLIEKQFGSQATVMETDVRKFYDDNKEKLFKHGERINVSHLMVPAPEKSPVEVKKQAKEKALALLKRVQAGEEFAALVKAEPGAPAKELVEDLGEIGKGQTVPAFEKAAFALKEGEVSGVVETPSGYHIIKVAQKLAPSTDKYPDVQLKIVSALKREKIRKLLSEFIEQLRAKAKIEKV